MTESIHVDQLLPHPPAAVWRALTEPDLLARWWTTGDIRAEVGHSFLLDMEGWGQVPCTILEAVPPERLVVAPDCGMKYLPRELAFRKLQAMVAGARLVREDLAA